MTHGGSRRDRHEQPKGTVVFTAVRACAPTQSAMHDYRTLFRPRRGRVAGCTRDHRRVGARRRLLGLLRSLGMTRPQLRSAPRPADWSLRSSQCSRGWTRRRTSRASRVPAAKRRWVFRDSGREPPCVRWRAPKTIRHTHAVLHRALADAQRLGPRHAHAGRPPPQLRHARAHPPRSRLPNDSDTPRPSPRWTSTPTSPPASTHTPPTSSPTSSSTAGPTMAEPWRRANRR